MNNTITNPLEGSLFTLEELEKVRRTGEDKNLPSKGTDYMYVVANNYSLTHRLAYVRHHMLICYRPKNRVQRYTVLDCHDRITSDLLQKEDQCAFWYESAGCATEQVGWTGSWLNPEEAEFYMIPVCDQVSTELLETLRAASLSNLETMWNWVKAKGDNGFPTSAEMLVFMNALSGDVDVIRVKARIALCELLGATKIPDGWVAEWLRPIFGISGLTETEVVVKRAANSYDLTHLSKEDYENRPQFYALDLGDEFQRIISLVAQRAYGDSAEYDKYMAEHRIYGKNTQDRPIEAYRSIHMDRQLVLIAQSGTAVNRADWGSVLYEWSGVLYDMNLL